MFNLLDNILIAGITGFQILDLTHVIDENTVVWDGSCGFVSELTGDYNQGGFRGQKFIMRSCLGTHLDSPAHCFKGKEDCAALNLVNLIVPAYVIDLSSKTYEDYGIDLDDLKAFENKFGQIQQNSLVFFFTGWSKYWKNPADYRNEKDGTPHFPFIKEEVIKVLLERNIAGIGIDTFSPDPFNAGAPVHKLLLGAGKYIIENVANLEMMPPSNAYAIALPLKIQGGAESPIRLIGILKK